MPDSTLLKEVITKEGNEIILKSKDGKKVLGRFPFGEGEDYKTEESARKAAEKREREVQFFKRTKEELPISSDLREALSLGERERMVSAAFRKEFRPPDQIGDMVPWEDRPRIQEVYDDFLLVVEGEQKFRVGYVRDAQHNITFDARSEWKKAEVEVVVVESEDGSLEHCVLDMHMPIQITESPDLEFKEGMEADIVIVQPGFGNPKDKNYYSKEFLSREAHKFAGAKMHLSHEGKDRSVRNWVATIKEAGKRFLPDGSAVGKIAVHKKEFWEDLKNLDNHGLLHTMHNSILAVGQARPGTIDGKKASIVETINRVRSVDFVPRAGAGGHVLSLIEQYTESGDIDFIAYEELCERRPDLVELANKNDIKLQEDLTTMTETLEEVQDELKKANISLEEAQVELTEGRQQAAKDSAVRILAEKAADPKVSLPQVVVKRITAIIEEGEFAEEADVEKEVEALIGVEQEYLAELSKNGSIVTGMGESDEEAGGDDESSDLSEENLEERNKAIDAVLQKHGVPVVLQEAQSG